MSRLTIRMPTTLGESGDASPRRDAASTVRSPADDRLKPARAFASWVGCWAGAETERTGDDA